tara:strand:- start:316 stop:1236 length:921 start_codon:yes stop_codon:yes gene_type:complete
MNKNSKIYVAGHNGLVGSAILKKLKKNGFTKLFYKSSKSLDLTNQIKTYNYLKKISPDWVIIAAAKVGGIEANRKFPVEFLTKNILIQNNLINGSFTHGVKNLLFLGSSCVYPISKKMIKETDFLKGRLEKTNEAYAIAKISGIKLCEYYSNQYNLNYFTLMPCNVFGPEDNYNLETSHFIPALIKKIHIAKVKKKNFITLWGSGKPLREVIFSEDLADACLYMMKKKHKKNLINIGTDIEFSIKQFANIIMKELDYKVKIIFDKTKPDGVYRKKLNNNIAKNLGWQKKIKIQYAIRKTYESFIKK